MMTPKTLSVVSLPGLHLDTLGHYFAALGLLRIAARKWPQVKGCWKNGTFLLIGAPHDCSELESFLLEIGKNKQWTPYSKGWDVFQKKDTKAQSAENSSGWCSQFATELEVLHFHSHIAAASRLSFNPVFGSGGNAGARIFAKGWSNACEALAPKKFPRGITAETVAQDLRAFLKGETCTYLSDFSAGCWFSAANKMFNNGTERPFRGGQVTPWAMLLACEAFPLLVGGTSRQIGFHRKATGAFPFVTLGAAPQNEQEAGMIVGEFWAPVWQQPLSVSEATALIQRGRAEANGRGAITAAAFAAAVIQKGTDAGLAEFRRFSLLRTTSENTFESRLSSIHPVDDRSDSTQAESVNKILHLRDSLPRDFQKGKRWVYLGLQGPVDRALIELAEVAGREDLRHERSWALVDSIFTALEKADRNKTFRAEKIRFELLPSAWAVSLLADGHENSVEARIALALATLRPFQSKPKTLAPKNAPTSLLAYRLGVTGHRRWWQIPESVPLRHVWSLRNIGDNLCAVIQRRLFESVAASNPPFDAQFALSLSDTIAFLQGATDDNALALWLDRFLLFDWTFVPEQERAALSAFLGMGHSPKSPAAPETCLYGFFRPLLHSYTFEALRDPPNSGNLPVPASGSIRRVVALLERGDTTEGWKAAASIYQGLGLAIANFGPLSLEYPPSKRLLASLLLPTSPTMVASLFTRWQAPKKQDQPRLY